MDISGAAESDEVSGVVTLQPAGEVDRSRIIIDAAAMKIQAAFRGYGVRRRNTLTHLHKIGSVRRKLNALQAKAADPAYIEGICVDVMECRKLTEGIMALLLQLDALQGVHPVVRDLRRSLNREVVQFMEVIDAVVVGTDSYPWQDSRNAYNIVRSNSISLRDRSASYPLRRVFNLDNHVYPEQSGESISDTRFDYDLQEAGASCCDSTPLAGKVDDRLCGMSTQGSCDSENEEVRKWVGNSRREVEFDHSEADSVELNSTLAAALVVQSRFRGYRVRSSSPLKHLRNISNVRSKLRELSIQVSTPGFLLKLQSDRMERLKMTESITALLLQLDSVQGVDQVVRNIRKSITREVFNLQDFVDTVINKAENISSRVVTSVGSHANLEEQRSLDNFYREIPATALLSEGKNSSYDVDEEEIIGHQVLDGLTVRDNFAREVVLGDPLDLQSRSISSDKIGDDLKLDHAANELSMECNSPKKALDNVQVRELDIPVLNSTTSCLSSESAEGSGVNDQQFGPCAAILLVNDDPCHCYVEHTGMGTFLGSFSSSTLGLVSAQEVLCKDIIPKTPVNNLWHDKFVDVVDVEACTFAESDHVSPEDLQACALPGVGRVNVTSKSVSFVRQMYDTQHMATCGSHHGSNISEQTTEPKSASKIEASKSHATGIQQFEVLSDLHMSADSDESGLIAQKYNLIRTTATGPMFNVERILLSNVPSQTKDELVLPSASLSEGCICSGIQDVNDAPYQTANVCGDICCEGDKILAQGQVDFKYGKESSDYLQVCSEYGVPTEKVKEYAGEAVEASLLLTTAEGACHMLVLDRLSGNHKPSGFVDIISADPAATVHNKKHQDDERVDFVGHLIDENTKLRTLLNEILIFAERHSSKGTTVKGRHEKGEGDVIKYKRRDDIWRKKSRSVRRR